MSDHAVPVDHAGASEPSQAELMSHVPPGSLWPLLLTGALTCIPFGTLAFTAPNVLFTWQVPADKTAAGSAKPAEVMLAELAQAVAQQHSLGFWLLAIGGLALLVTLMGWANQIIREKVISHDVVAQQHDLKHFLAMFLVSEFAAFGAIFAYFYHRKIWAGGPNADYVYGPHGIPGLHFGGPLVAYATFILIFSSLTCEIAHRCLEHGRLGAARLLLITTIVLGVIFLGFQGFEYGELVQRGFTTTALGDHPAASFVSLFFASTGFHGLHVAIGLVMLFMVLMRLELGHFRGRRHFSMVAASWYWHFVDIVWVALFITVYVVA